MKDFDVNSIQLKLQHPGITLEPFMEQLILEQLERVGRTFSRITGCEMMLRTEKHDKGLNCFMEAKLFIPGHIIFSKQQAENFRLATAKLFDDLNDQLVRTKEKMQNKQAPDLLGGGDGQLS